MKITITWCTEDVLDRARETGVACTKEKANDVLKKIEDNLDASEGVTWYTIDNYLDEIEE